MKSPLVTASIGLCLTRIGSSVLAQDRPIMKNGDVVIGLFQGMFGANILTFNPGWDQSGNNTDTFTDVRSIKQSLQDQGIEVPGEIDAPEGPGSFMLTDPDGNQILIDQHR